MLSFLGLKLRCAQSCRNLCNPMDCSPPLSMEFSRQEYWSGLPFPSPGDFPSPGIKPMASALAGGFFIRATREALKIILTQFNFS